MKYRTKDGRHGYSGTDWKPNPKTKYERFLLHLERDKKAQEMACVEELPKDPLSI